MFMSFASSDFRPALMRLERQVRTCKCFDKSFFFKETDLDRHYKRKFRPHIYRRGYGYWTWKPILVRKVLDTLVDGDILVYADAGCDFRSDAEQRLRHYISLAQETHTGIVAFQDEHMQRDYTKGDVFHALCENGRTDIVANSPMVVATYFVLRKCADSYSLIREWENVALWDFHLFTDKKSKTPNYPSFVEHRHDQSVFSVLLSKRSAYLFPPKELCRSNSNSVPIVASHRKEVDRLTRIRRKLLLPYRLVLALYLIWVEKFYFTKRYVW